MSRRAKEASSLIARQLVSSWIKELQDSKTTPHGLPEDILVNALDGYGLKTSVGRSSDQKHKIF
jgi:hypothetical protein